MLCDWPGDQHRGFHQQPLCNLANFKFWLRESQARLLGNQEKKTSEEFSWVISSHRGINEGCLPSNPGEKPLRPFPLHCASCQSVALLGSPWK